MSLCALCSLEISNAAGLGRHLMETIGPRVIASCATSSIAGRFPPGSSPTRARTHGAPPPAPVDIAVGLSLGNRLALTLSRTEPQSPARSRSLRADRRST